jgi:signal transduction histidine kinase
VSIKLLLASQAYETPAVIAAFLTEKQNTSDATGNCCFRSASDVTFETDALQLRILLANLFDNAVEYTNHGGSVEVEWRAGPHGIEFRIATTGCELSERQVTQVFDRFWRADSARAATGAHSGLGLSLCQKIVEVLGGSIDAALDAGNFVVTLRLAAEIQQRPPSTTEEHRERVSGVG